MLSLQTVPRATVLSFTPVGDTCPSDQGTVLNTLAAINKSIQNIKIIPDDSLKQAVIAGTAELKRIEVANTRELTNTITSSSEDLKDVVQQSIDVVGTTVGTAVADLGSTVSTVQNGVAAVGTGVATLGSAVSAIQTGVAALGTGVAALGSTVDTVQTGVAALGTGVSAIQTGVAALSTGVVNVGSTVSAIQTGVGSLNADLASMTSTVGDIQGGLSGLATTVSQGNTDIIALLNNIQAGLAEDNDLSSLLLTIPTNIAPADLATARSLLLPTPGATLQSDVESLNSIVNGTPTGSTLQSRLNSLSSSLLATPTNVLTTDLTTVRELFVDTPGATLQADANTLTSLLDPTGTSSVQARIAGLNTVVGGSGSLATRLNAATASLDGVVALTGLSTFTISTAASLNGGTITITGNDGTNGSNYSLDPSAILPLGNGALFVFTKNAASITFVNNSGTTLGTANDLATYLANTYPAGAILKASMLAKINSLRTLAGDHSNVLSNVVSLRNSILTNPMGSALTDLTTARSFLVTTPGTTLEGDVRSLNTQLDGTAAGSTLENRIGTLSAYIGGSGTTLADQLGDLGTGGTLLEAIGGASQDVSSALGAVATNVSGNANFSSSLNAQVVDQRSRLDDILTGLPANGNYAVVGSVGSDGNGGVNIEIIAGLGSANGTYNLSSAAIGSGIGNGSTFTLTNTPNTIELKNASGSTISSQPQALSYLKSLYPDNSRIALNISDTITSLSTMVGGNASSIRSRLGAVDTRLLQLPSGILQEDLGTVRSLLTPLPTSTLEADIQDLNALLNGSTSGSTTRSRIGVPTVNGASSNLATIIGGNESTLAEQLGDPVTGTGGLAGLIGASSAVDSAIFDNTALTPLRAATNLREQLAAFLALFTSRGLITIDLTGSAPTSLGELLSKILSPF